MSAAHDTATEPDEQVVRRFLGRTKQLGAVTGEPQDSPASAPVGCLEFSIEAKPKLSSESSLADLFLDQLHEVRRL